MTVYADVLVIVNLYVDFFLLWCTQQVLQLRAGPWRMVLGAFVGGLCALACLYPLPWWGSLLWGGASAALVTAAAFCPLSRRGFLKTALCFWLFSLALAGFFLFLIQWVGTQNVALVGHTIYLNLSLPLLFCLTCGAYGAFWVFRRVLARDAGAARSCAIAVEH